MKLIQNTKRRFILGLLFASVLFVVFPVRPIGGSEGTEPEANAASREPSHFFFSDKNLEERSGVFYFFFSKADLSQVDGDVYSFFSNVTVNDAGGPSLAADLTIHTLSSIIVYHGHESVEIKAMLPFIPFVGNEDTQDGLTTYDDVIPLVWLQVASGMLTLLICLALLPVKRSFFEQAAAGLLHKPADAVKKGLTFYFIFMSISVIFFLSVVGFPVTVFILALMVVGVTLGEISIGILLGLLMGGDLGIGVSVYAHMIMGVAMIELVKLIPVFGGVITFVFLPIMALGVVASGILNGYVRHVFFSLPYEKTAPKIAAPHDPARIRNIVLGK